VKLAEVAESQDGETGGAAPCYRSALDIAIALRDSGRLAPADAWMVGELEARLVRVQRPAARQWVSDDRSRRFLTWLSRGLRSARCPLRTEVKFGHRARARVCGHWRTG
jgi:hypothetical protein